MFVAGEQAMDGDVKVTVLEIYISENNEGIALVDDGITCYPIDMSELKEVEKTDKF